MRRNILVIIAVAVVVVAAAASFELGLLPVGGGSTSVCSSCFQQEPVVDVIMPVLGTSGNSTDANRLLNMTLGETKTYQVNVYPTIQLNATMSFEIVLAPGTATQPAVQGIAAAFNPTTLALGANSKGSTSMTLSVVNTAPRGTYDVVVSATNQANSSEVWGLYFEISVS